MPAPHASPWPRLQMPARVHGWRPTHGACCEGARLKAATPLPAEPWPFPWLRLQAHVTRFATTPLTFTRGHASLGRWWCRAKTWWRCCRAYIPRALPPNSACSGRMTAAWRVETSFTAPCVGSARPGPIRLVASRAQAPTLHAAEPRRRAGQRGPEEHASGHARMRRMPLVHRQASSRGSSRGRRARPSSNPPHSQVTHLSANPFLPAGEAASEPPLGALGDQA